MTYKGHIRNRAIVLDDAVQLPEGAEVTVEICARPGGTNADAGVCLDPWAAVEKEIETLGQKTDELIAQELVPPAAAAMHRIAPLLSTLRRKNLDVPFRAVPDGEGGIVLEWISPSCREIVRTIEISAEGNVEVAEFTDNRLQRRYQLK